MTNNNLINRNFNLNNYAYLNSNSSLNNNNLNNSTSFQDILNKEANLQSNTNEVQFSKHASMRLASRNLKLDNNQMQRIKDGIDKANQKGIKDSLVLVDDIVLVVNIKSKTIITAIENESNKVYSNIDGAVIV